MRVDTGLEQLFFTTVPIMTQSNTAPGSYGFGTGFIFNYQTEELKGTDSHYYFLVTNKHVVNSSDLGRIEFFRQSADDQPILGQVERVTIQNIATAFHGHPTSSVDVAVMLLYDVLAELEQRGVDIFYRSIPDEYALTDAAMEELDAIEEVTFIGYPQLLRDPVNLTPLARRGTTATPPSIDYNGEPTFLVDAAVFGGSSGSPVFLAGPAMRVRKNLVNFTHRVKFVGVIAQYFSTQTVGEIRLSNDPNAVAVAASMVHAMNLGVVFKASTVRETIQDFLATHGYVQPSRENAIEPVSVD